MARLGPRVCVAAPSPLLASLRNRAVSTAQAAEASMVAALATQRSERSHAQLRRPKVVATATASHAARPTSDAAPESSAGVDPYQLIGFTVLDASHKNTYVGVVEDVLSMAETGQAQPLLHVRAPRDPQQPDGDPREEHLIPYVPQIVPSVDRAAGLVFIQPPTGLLDLGRQHLMLAKLERDLAPFTTPPPLSVLSRMGLRVMPTSAQLAAAGRRDLVLAIRKAGGILEVAQALRLRSQRKPAGYWEEEAHLDEELTLFVATHWTQFTDPDSRQPYWYNQITHRISWEEPILPQRIEVDDVGGYILTEAEEDRVMPSRSSLFAAGRYDLHHAILSHGGYTAASELLGRRPAWPPSQHLQNLGALRQELLGFVRETSLPRGRLPTASQLTNAGRGDLLQAIVHRGGFAATAAALGWSTRRRGKQAWEDAEAVAAELQRYIRRSQFPELCSPEPRWGGAKAQPPQGKARQQRQSQRLERGPGQRQEQEEGDGECVAEALPPGAKMPTARELAAAGRHDLKYAVQRHGSAKLAALLGLPPNRRGAHNHRRARVEQAVEGGAAAMEPST